MHINIQSIVPKIDILQVEAQSYDILVFTETWLAANTDSCTIAIQNFDPPFRYDRQGRLGGGVAIYTRSGLLCKRRDDFEITGLEAVWVELELQQRKLLIGGFYRPPNSNNDYWSLLEESIDRAYSIHSNNVIVTRDFNINILHSPQNKMSSLISLFNSVQLITEPTHYTEHSSSLIDIAFTNHPELVVTSVTSDPFIPLPYSNRDEIHQTKNDLF